MKIVNQISAARVTQPQPAVIGDWVQSVLADHPMLNRRDAFNLALIKTLTSVDASEAKSYFIFANEKRINSVTAKERTRHSIIRADGIGAPRLVCGAPGHGWLTRDWTLQLDGLAGESSGTLSVVQQRAVDGALPNGDLLDEIRRTFARVLANGPGEITVHEVPPTLEASVEVTPAPLGLDSGGDHLLPVSPNFRDGARIELPAGTAAQLLTVVRDRHLVTVETDGELALSLAGGRAGAPSSIRLVTDGNNATFVLDLAEEGATTRQRTFRAAMAALDRVASLVKEAAPGAASSISAFIESCRSERSDMSRNQHFIPAWNAKTPGGAIRLSSRLLIPIVVRVRTTSEFFSLQHNFYSAESWLLQRERSRATGMRQQTRDANRKYTMRGPAQVMVDDKLTLAFRYAETGTVPMGKTAPIGNDGSWFWEIGYRQAESDDGRQEVTLSVNSLSRSLDFLYYGPELARFMSAFAWQIQSLDPSAEFKTLAISV
jgi:hypothetical protein